LYINDVRQFKEKIKDHSEELLIQLEDSSIHNSQMLKKRSIDEILEFVENENSNNIQNSNILDDEMINLEPNQRIHIQKVEGLKKRS